MVIAHLTHPVIDGDDDDDDDERMNIMIMAVKKYIVFLEPLPNGAKAHMVDFE